MKFSIISSANSIETANYAMSSFIDILENNPAFREAHGFSTKDVSDLKIFRRQVLRGYFAELKAKNVRTKRLST